jgi:Flp pilus assembly protein TadD
MRAFFLLLLLSAGCAAQSGGTEAVVRQAYEAGEAALRQGDLATAEKSFLQVLALVPRDVGARVNLGVIAMREQKWARALEYLQHAEKLAPQVTGIRLNIGLVHYRQRDLNEAEAADAARGRSHWSR